MINDFLSYGFLRQALLGAILSALATSLLSVFVALKKISYMGEAFSHIAFAGIALALLVGWKIDLTATMFVVFTGLIIALISKNFNIEETNITIIFLSVSMAVGILLININKNYTIDLASYLFGNILLVTARDNLILVFLVVFNLLFVILFYKEMFYITYNIDVAEIFGVPVKTVYYLFIFLIAVNIVISVKIVGIVLVTAQIILPGFTALFLVRNVKKAIFLSVLIAASGHLSGLILSFIFDIPSGSSIVLTLFLYFLLSLLINKYFITN